MSIYLKHFALKREPFSIVPDPAFLYPSQQHRQAVAHIKYGLDREGGFVLLTGEVGTGKTTLTRTILEKIPAHVRVAYVLNSKLNETDLLASICDELAITLSKKKDLSFAKVCVDALNQDLLKSHAEGKKTLIVIEEAQNLSDEVLETLRLLSNLETNTHKLLHILLVGQPELVGILGKQNLRQLNQRVVSRFHLLPLDKAELSNYINHRLHYAGARSSLFNSSCINVIFKLTKGVPRLVNLICHQSMLASYSLGYKTVSASLVKNAAKEILGDLGPTNTSKHSTIAAVLFGIAILISFNTPAIKNIFLTQIAPISYESEKERMSSASISEFDLMADRLVQTTQENVEEFVEPEVFDDGSSDIHDASNTGLKPLDTLLSLWSVEASDIYTFEELLSFSDKFGLKAERISDGTIDKLVVIDRPGLVLLRQPSGIVRGREMTKMGEDSVSLIINEQLRSIDHESFIKKWTGSFIYLWRPPKTFDILQIDAVDSVAMNWLQNKLSLVDPYNARVITGGRYTKAVQQQVTQFQQSQNIRPDGIVGRETLMRLNQMTDQNIPRLMLIGN